MSDTPRTDALLKNRPALWDDWNSADFHELETLARQLERDLETVRDAHMANCLASDTLRNEIDNLREQLAQRPEEAPLDPAKFNDLLIEYGNLQFECGEHDGTTESYDRLMHAMQIARRALCDYVLKSGSMNIAPSKEG